MSSVEGRAAPMGTLVAGPAPPVPARPIGRSDGSAAATGADPAAPPVAPPTEGFDAAAPAPGLAALLSQARQAQAQLVAQPLAITNYNGELILKLLGG